MDTFINNVKTFFTNAGLNILLGIIVIIVGLLICKVVKIVLRRAFRRSKRDEAMSHFVISLTDIILKIIVLICALATMGINTASIITVLGTCGVAIGLALKDSLSNLASGVLIIYNRPFKKGDYIETPDVAGKVNTINLFNTVLLTSDNKEIVIPNGTLAGEHIINYSTTGTRRVELKFGISYDNDYKEAQKIILELCNAHKSVLKDPAPICRLTEHGASALILVTRVWTLTDDYWDVYFDLTEQVKDAFDAAGIGIPYPQMDVHIRDTVEKQ
ncbi:MAG: mechanosensitive ion channel [Firmicutes bacterium]|uniref:Mechanosensitive ion channel n=1 Tax=Candidatus Stercoripulliclostridium pullicola TaxID=2840953 RepID=A0A940DF80_9FIRM|nr:mechanosensitive ion channel [Candidatus Stercoripulliclostridium pullicola]